MNGKEIADAVSSALHDAERDRIDEEVMAIFIRYGEKVDWDIVCEITSLVLRESRKVRP